MKYNEHLDKLIADLDSIYDIAEGDYEAGKEQGISKEGIAIRRERLNYLYKARDYLTNAYKEG